MFTTGATRSFSATTGTAAKSNSTIFSPFLSARAQELLHHATDFIDKEIMPHEEEICTYCVESERKWTHIHPKMEELKAKVSFKPK